MSDLNGPKGWCKTNRNSLSQFMRRRLRYAWVSVHLRLDFNGKVYPSAGQTFNAGRNAHKRDKRRSLQA